MRHDITQRLGSWSFVLAGILALIIGLLLPLTTGMQFATASTPATMAYQYENKPAENGRYTNLARSAVDNHGNVYTVGLITDTLDMDPTSGTDTVTVHQDTAGFIRKMTGSGEYIDTTVLGGPNTFRVFIDSIVFDANYSSYYITGSFSGTVDFDPNGSGEEVTAETKTAGFAAKYSTANDHLVTLRTLGGDSEASSEINSLAINPIDGSIALSGSFYLNDGDGDDAVNLAGSGGEPDTFTPHSSAVAFISFYSSGFAYTSSDVYDANDLNLRTYAHSLTYVGNSHVSSSSLYAAIGLEAYDGDADGTLHLFTFDDGFDLRSYDYEYDISQYRATSLVAHYYSRWSGDLPRGNNFIPYENDAENPDSYVYIQKILTAGDFNEDFTIAVVGSANGNVSLGPLEKSVRYGGFVTRMNNGEYTDTFVNTNQTGMNLYYYDAALDSSGNIYTVGEAYASDGEVAHDFNPDTGVDMHTVTDINAVLTKWNSDNSYDYSIVSGSSKSAPGTVYGWASSVAVNSDKIYVNSNVGYEYTSTGDECTVQNYYRDGEAPVMFSATGNLSNADWLDFAAIPDQYGENAADCDTDGDGVPDTSENLVNDGDANNDGMLDSEQDNVTTMINPQTDEVATLEINGSSDICGLSNVSIKSEAELSNNSEFNFPLGLFDFTANCIEQGETATITQYYYNPPAGNYTVQKFLDGIYAEIEGATVAIETIDGQPVLVVTYQVTDGGELDADGEENGVIVDPAGPSVLAAIDETNSGSGMPTAVRPPNTGLSPVDKTGAIITLIAGIILASLLAVAPIRRKLFGTN